MTSSIDQQIDILFIKELGSEYDAIKMDFTKKNFFELKKSIHRLHGALCYCNFPLLRSITASFEQALNSNNLHKIEELWPLFEQEVLAILNQ